MGVDITYRPALYVNFPFAFAAWNCLIISGTLFAVPPWFVGGAGAPEFDCPAIL